MIAIGVSKLAAICASFYIFVSHAVSDMEFILIGYKYASEYPSKRGKPLFCD